MCCCRQGSQCCAVVWRCSVSTRRYDLDALEDAADHLRDTERAEWRRAADSDWRSELPLRPDHSPCEYDPSDVADLDGGR